VKLLVSVNDLVGSRVFLLAIKELNRWICIHFFFRLKTGRSDWFGLKMLRKGKAALEIVFRKREVDLPYGRWARESLLLGRLVHRD